MSLRSREILKAFFEKGDFPTAAQFIDFIDSCLNLIDDPVTGLDEKVKHSATDQLANYLNSKLTAGSGVTFTVLNPGANEQLQISASSGAGVWGAISGTLSDQTDLQGELDDKQDVIDDSDDISEGSVNLFLTTTERTNIGLNDTHRGVTTGNPHNVNKSDVSLSNVDNTADADKPVSTAIQTALDLKVNNSEVGVNNGIAELDSNGFVPASQLPSYVDDVLEFANLAAFPVTGETGKIYVAIDTGLIYRWSGSVYVVISTTIALGETSTTAYRGDRGKTAFDHSQLTTGNPHSVVATEISDFDTEVANNSAVAANTAKNTNVNTDLSLGTVTAVTMIVISSDGTNVTLIAASTIDAGLLTAAKWNEIVANNAKVSNVSTNLSEGTSTETTVNVNSSDGTNATLVAASTSRAGLLTKAKFDEIVANNAKVSYSDVDNVVLLTGNQTVVGEKTLSNNLKVNAQAHGGDTLESFSASKTFDCDDGNVFEMDVTASTTIGIINEEAGTYIFRLKINTGTPPTITVGASFGTKLPNASLDFDNTDTSVNILTLVVWPSGAKDYTISN